jgi:hypothetical protein
LNEDALTLLCRLVRAVNNRNAESAEHIAKQADDWLRRSGYYDRLSPLRDAEGGA